MKFKSRLESQFYDTYGLSYEPKSFLYTVVHSYTPDFQVSPTAYVETKGLFTGTDRNKHLYIKKQHPELSILLVFQEPSRKLNKNSKTTYAMWCQKNDLPWCGVRDTKKIEEFIRTHTYS